MKLKNLAVTFMVGAAFMCAAHAEEPVNLFFSAAHVKPHGQTTLGIVTVPGGIGASESYNFQSIPVETKTGNKTTLSSVTQATGFGIRVVPREEHGSAWTVDVTYIVKDAGVTLVEATKTVQLKHGQSADLPVAGSEKLVLSLQ